MAFKMATNGFLDEIRGSGIPFLRRLMPTEVKEDKKLISVSFVKSGFPMAKILTGKNNTKKDVIIQKAALLFKSKSYTSASMRELGVELGVEAPSLYNHIGSKSELLQAICF